ncbi:MAG: phosphoglycerate kinase [Eubacteriales bacterium]|nr:phosphoglycerate kinase [Eubacteriales bacterium]
MEVKMNPLERFNYNGKTVLLRVDVNSPIDPQTRKIVSENRIKKSIPTIKYLIENGAKLAIVAHQGDTLDYQNLMSMQEHAEKLAFYLGKPIQYIEDVCGPTAVNAVKALKSGEIVFLGNLRYLTEEVSGFEKEVKLNAKEMLDTWLVRTMAPLFDIYVNDAFAAAHRNCPSMVAFQELLPTAGGRLLYDEYEALYKVLNGAVKPAVFVLGGAKISDAFGMMKTVLQNGTADKILASGVTGVIMLLAQGLKIGAKYEQFLKDKDLLVFVEPAREMLRDFPGRIEVPSDLAYEVDGQRINTGLDKLPMDDKMFLDIGDDTIARFDAVIKTAGTIFVNGPAGVYENPLFEKGTQSLWQSIADAPGYSVIGGGDTVSAAGRYIDLKKINYVCTAGGAMVRFLSGKKLPLIEAMEAAFERDGKK